MSAHLAVSAPPDGYERSLGAGVYLIEPLFDGFPSSVKVLVSGEAVSHLRSEEWDRSVVGGFRDLAHAVKATGGFMTWDRVKAGRSALRMLYDHQDETMLDTEVHGYQWGTLLSTRHVETLGGIDRVRSEAPVATVDEILPNGRLVFLQLCDEFVPPRPEQLRSLKEYLADVLPTERGPQAGFPLSLPLVGVVDEPLYRVELPEPLWGRDWKDEATSAFPAVQPTIEVPGQLDDELRESLERLLHRWCSAALGGEYGDPPHWASEIEWLPGEKTSVVQLTLDAESADQAVLSALERLVADWADTTGRNARVRIPGLLPEDPD